MTASRVNLSGSANQTWARAGGSFSFEISYLRGGAACRHTVSLFYVNQGTLSVWLDVHAVWLDVYDGWMFMMAVWLYVNESCHALVPYIQAHT